MKKIIILATLLVMGASAANAQFTFGIKGGLNLADISNSQKIANAEDVDAKMKPSFYLGAFGEYKFNDFIAISPELVYSRQGAKAVAKEGDGKFFMRQNYINLPVLAKLYLIDNSLSLDLGPQFGLLAGSKAVTKVDGDTGDEDTKDFYNSFDVSFAMGLTYDFGNHFLVQARYNLGLTDSAKDSTYDVKFKNNVFQLGVGYRF